MKAVRWVFVTTAACVICFIQAIDGVDVQKISPRSTTCWAGLGLPYANIVGHAAVGSAAKPLAIYLDGTGMDMTSASSDLTRMMADRGFVAVNLQYNNEGYPGSCEEFEQKAKYLSSCIDDICNHNTSTISGNDVSHNELNIDCSLGVAMYGYSQGAQLSLIARNFNNKVTAAFSISGTIFTAGLPKNKPCFQSEALALDKTKRRVVIGENDGYFGGDGKNYPSLDSGIPQEVIDAARNNSGYGEFCNTSTYDCIQPDGSGYRVVTSKESGISTMGHLWWLDYFTISNIFRWGKPDFKMKSVFKYTSQDWGASDGLTWLAKVARTANNSQGPLANAATRTPRRLQLGRSWLVHSDVTEEVLSFRIATWVSCVPIAVAILVGLDRVMRGREQVGYFAYAGSFKKYFFEVGVGSSTTVPKEHRLCPLGEP